ncbi:MAG: hypothetical protein ACREXR_14805 [Gammaproteobacteria bacterium]
MPDIPVTLLCNNRFKENVELLVGRKTAAPSDSSGLWVGAGTVSVFLARGRAAGLS